MHELPIEKPTIPYDALLILFYGGPESPDQVEPFLDRLFQGKPVSPAARQKAVQKYLTLGGKSPIMDEARLFAEQLRSLLPSLSVHIACLYADPLLEDVVRQIAKSGHHSVLVFIASPFGSPQSCGRYRKRLGEAVRSFGGNTHFHTVLPFFDHPKWIRAEADLLLSLQAESELESLDWAKPNSGRPGADTMVLFSAHSLPMEDASSSRYPHQLASTAQKIATASGIDGVVPWEIVYQSRSGRPGSPWIGPDIQEFIREDNSAHPDRKRYLILPFGFFFDNLETVCDLDQELSPLACELGVVIKRAPAAARADKSTDLILALLSEQESGTDCPEPENCGLHCGKTLIAARPKN